MTGDLPEGWEWATLGDLGIEIRGQLTPQGGSVYDLYSVPAFSTKRPERIDGTSIKSGKRAVRADDVLICKINPRINRVWTVDENDGFPQVASTEYLVLRLHDQRMAPLVQWYLSSPRFREWIKLSAEGATGSHTRAKSGPIMDQMIAVPPLEQQSRIVAAIEEHFSRLDAVESALTQSLKRFASLRTAILIDTFCVNRDLPPGWQRTTIGEVAEVQLGRQRSPENHSGSQMRPYLRSANVTWQGTCLEDVKEMNFDDSDFEKYKLEPGDLLLNEASGSPSEVGKPAMWSGEITECCFQNTLLRLRPQELSREYLYWYCYLSALTGHFGEAGRGVNIRHLGKNGLAQFPISIAPCEQRAEIVSRLEEQVEQISALERSANAALDRVAALRRAVLAEAFVGRLVPQHPDDEPASILLERIVFSRQSEPKRRQKAKT